MSFRPTIVRALGIALLPAALFGEAPSTQPETPHLSPVDIFELQWATDPQISPDGSKIVYIRNSMDRESDRRRSRVWIMGFDGDGSRPVSPPGIDATLARWSPDGSRICYLESVEDDSTLVVTSPDDDRRIEITGFEGKPGGFSWSPSGDRIAFAMTVPQTRPPIAELPSPSGDAEWAEPPNVVESFIYRADGKGYLIDGFVQLFVVPSSGGEPRQLTSGPFHYFDSRTLDPGPAPIWTPDGRSLIFSANLNDDWRLDPLDYDIHELELESGRLQTLTTRQGPDTHPALSPDGHQIAFLGFEDRYQGHQQTVLSVMNRDGSAIRTLGAELDRDFQAPQWNSSASGLFFIYESEGDGKLAHVDLEGEIEVLVSGLGGSSLGRPYASGSFSVSNTDRYVTMITSPTHPADLVVGGGSDAEPVRITDLNRAWLQNRRLAEIEEIWFESRFDKRRIQGWIVKPPGFEPSKQYPLILEIHGGPFLNYGARFAAEIQLYAAAGYVVLYANPRGSTSYGEEFANLIHHNYPGEDFDDLMSAVDAVIARGYVDRQRLYVTGGSGGGVLTAWIVGKTQRFRAAVSAKPVINWYSFALTADSYNFFYRYWFPGAPWEIADQYMERSPISLVGEVQTPTMLLTGEEDYRTPISESEQYYQALRLRGVDTALVRIPGASHSIAKRPSHLIAKVAFILGWFDRYR